MDVSLGIFFGLVAAGIIYWTLDALGFVLYAKWKRGIDQVIDGMKAEQEAKWGEDPTIGYEIMYPAVYNLYGPGHDWNFPKRTDNNTFVLKSKEGATISPGKSHIVGTGVRLEIPEGYRLKITSQGGLAAKHSVNVINSPGYYGPEYTGEIKVILHNHDRNAYHVKPGHDIAEFSLVREPVNVLFSNLDGHSNDPNGEE